MPDIDDTPNHDLEYLRLAADCIVLANDVLSPALQAHLQGMALVWLARVGEPGVTPAD